MALDDVLISIGESSNSEMCSQSSNKFWQQFSKIIGLQFFLPSNINANTQVQVIGIRKPKTKSLEKDPNQLCEMSMDSNVWSFHKVPYPLRQVNEKAYEPNVISIGPYHHGKKHLETMEVIKRNCFSKMIEDNNVKPEEFVTVMKKLEEKVRKCYEEPLDHFDSDTFVEMMVLDGCFIVLLFEKNNYLLTSLSELNRELPADIYCDLLLLENQLPFFVLSDLHDVIMSDVEIDQGCSWDPSFLLSVIPEPEPQLCLPKIFPQSKKFKHLLGLVYHTWVQDAEAEAKEKAKAKAKAKAEAEAEAEPKETKGKGRKDNCSREFIRCATELDEAGIKFPDKGKELQDKKGKASLFVIKFTDDGKLKIPTLSVIDSTERILRNFMAYEQFFKISEPTIVCDYVTLMDNLINSGKDVQLLCKCGIIDNWLGDDEVVAQMFNKVRNFTCVSIDSDSFYYDEIFDKVNGHCKKRRNRWRARLNKDYFNSPWSIISVLVAFVLLLLTLLQTIFSVLSYVHPK